MNEKEHDEEEKRMQAIINSYPGDTLIPELFLIDYLLDYEGAGIESACSHVSLFFGHFYIQKCMVNISISKAIDELSAFLDYLALNGYVRADACSAAKIEMKANKNKWIRQQRDWFEMDYDEYNEKYWGLSL